MRMEGSTRAAGLVPTFLSHGEASISPPARTLPLCESTWLGLSAIAEESVLDERQRFRKLDRSAVFWNRTLCNSSRQQLLPPPSPGNGVVNRKLKPERYPAISVAILGDPISNCGPLVVTAEHNRSLKEVGAVHLVRNG